MVVQSCLQDCMRPVMEAESRMKEEVQQIQVYINLVLLPDTIQKIEKGLWGQDSSRNVIVF